MIDIERDVLSWELQAKGTREHLPAGALHAPELYQALPYILTVVVLVLVSTGLAKRRLGAPAALGAPYLREER